MGTSTFSGPVRAGSSTTRGYMVQAQSATLNYGADGTTVTVGTVPANAQILEIYADVTTAFDAGTTNYISFGDGSTDNLYADNLAGGSVARVLASSDASQITNMVDVGTSDVTVVATYNQSGTAATAGVAECTVLYIQR